MTSTIRSTDGQSATKRWRTVDIVVASVIAVAFAVLFGAWNNFIYPTVSGPLSGSPFGPLIAGVWLLPAVVGGLVIRRPGAAFYTEFLAATLSIFFGSSWGFTVIMSGFWQGLGAELVFLLLAYRRWGVTAAVAAGIGAGLAMGIYESFVYVDTYSPGWKLIYIASAAVTGAIVAGWLGWLLVRAMARTGVLTPFASGRVQAEV
jgi:energy-coupling factor transport system substrate-specific component